MQTDNYRSNLKSALENLVKVNDSLYQSCIDIIVQGDLADWNKSVPIGEELHFDWELFKNSDDTNIQLLVKLMERVDSTYESIKNINAIKMD